MADTVVIRAAWKGREGPSHRRGDTGGDVRNPVRKAVNGWELLRIWQTDTKRVCKDCFYAVVGS